MAIFIVCRNCGQRIYLQTLRIQDLPYNFRITCNSCLAEQTYYRHEVSEERWNFSCPVCSGRFFTRVSPPRRLRCPHCSSLVYVGATGDVTVLQRGRPPVPPANALPVAGAIGGLLLGSVVGGPLGGLVGLLAGAALGTSAENREAREE